jgi:hypothetical protein
MPLVIRLRHENKVRKLVVLDVVIGVVNDELWRDRPVCFLPDISMQISAALVVVMAARPFVPCDAVVKDAVHTKSPSLMSPAGIH